MHVKAADAEQKRKLQRKKLRKRKLQRKKNNLFDLAKIKRPLGFPKAVFVCAKAITHMIKILLSQFDSRCSFNRHRNSHSFRHLLIWFHLQYA